ncbi:MAG TPA: caspase family protein, partial [Candidatus Ozemobacteraceae bacterium]|nr:caspase family protein [Candidatus Ozemobacteraceae bacterium]
MNHPRGYVVLILALVLVLSGVTPAIATDRRMDLTTSTDAVPSAGGGRVALLIGNSDYEHAALPNPVNDVRAFATTLKDIGWDVIQRENCDILAMEEAAKEFNDRLRKCDIGLFYYSGHGCQIDGENFLVPLKANLSKPLEIRHKCFPAKLLVDYMEDAGSKLNIIILDACRDNPFKGSSRSLSSGLAKMDLAPGRQMLLAYATDPGNVAQDGDPGSNSPFMKHMLKNIRTPGLDINKLFREVRKGVRSETGEKQRPWETSCLMDDFFFVPPDAVAPAVGPQATTGLATGTVPPAASDSTTAVSAAAP